LLALLGAPYIYIYGISSLRVNDVFDSCVMLTRNLGLSKPQE